jgi:predicted nucleotidyltransferase
LVLDELSLTSPETGMHSDAAQEFLLRLGGCGPDSLYEMQERDERNEMVRQRFEYTVTRYIRRPEVYIFGSSYTGLTNSSSDVDMLLVVNAAFAASTSAKQVEYDKIVEAESELVPLRNSERVILFLKGFIGSDFFRMTSNGKKVRRSRDAEEEDAEGSDMDEIDPVDDNAEEDDEKEDLEDEDEDDCDEEEAPKLKSAPTSTVSAGDALVNTANDHVVVRFTMFFAIKDFIKTHQSLLVANSEKVAIVKKSRAFIEQQEEREHDDKVLYLRKAMGALRDDPSYLVKDFIPRARVPVANFSDASVEPNVDCDVIVNNLLGLHNSRMIREYVYFDETGKIRAFIMLIKRFASKNRVNVASEHTLSSYAWVVMALHLLLRLGLLPNFQDDAVLSTIPSAERNVVNGVDCTFVVPHPSSAAARDARRAIASISLSQLVVKFFEYYTKGIDITQNCISMRNKGEVTYHTIIISIRACG